MRVKFILFFLSLPIAIYVKNGNCMMARHYFYSLNNLRQVSQQHNFNPKKKKTISHQSQNRWARRLLCWQSLYNEWTPFYSLSDKNMQKSASLMWLCYVPEHVNYQYLMPKCKIDSQKSVCLSVVFCFVFFSSSLLRIGCHNCVEAKHAVFGMWAMMETKISNNFGNQNSIICLFDFQSKFLFFVSKQTKGELAFAISEEVNGRYVNRIQDKPKKKKEFVICIEQTHGVIEMESHKLIGPDDCCCCIFEIRHLEWLQKQHKRYQKKQTHTQPTCLNNKKAIEKNLYRILKIACIPKKLNKNGRNNWKVHSAPLFVLYGSQNVAELRNNHKSHN